MRLLSLQPLILVACAASIAAQTPTRSDYPPLGRMIDVGGYNVHLYCVGTGEPTVMIVGAGFSVDWGLVQPAVAKSTRVCTYDPAGTAWSDPSPAAPTCYRHIDEIHTMLANAGIRGPVVLVGHSIGAVFARLYAQKYPGQVGGIVIVDHAAVIRMDSGPGGLSSAVAAGAVLGRGVQPRPGTQPSAPLAPLGATTLEGDPAFGKLPALDRKLHAWAVSLPDSRGRGAQRLMFDRCMAEVDSSKQTGAGSLERKPLIVISTGLRSRDYTVLQMKLLSLSSNSQQLIAGESGHAIPIDQPTVIVDAIDRVVRAFRERRPLAEIAR